MRRRLVAALAILLVAGGAAAPERVGTVRFGAAVPETALTSAWQRYGDTSDQWSGADGTTSVKLPDGRVVWLFSDTFLGTVNADHSRPRGAPFVNNSMVVQDGSDFTTLTGGSPSAPTSLVPSGTADGWLWVGDGTVEKDRLRVLYNRYSRTGAGPLDVRLTGTVLATFSLPDLKLTGTRPVPGGSRVAWGSAISESGDHTFVYGSELGRNANFAHLARARRGAVASAWEYWTGHGWSTRETDSARVLSGVGTGFSVDRVGGRYVLVTQELNAPMSPHIVAYQAPDPTGPFGEPEYVYVAPETGYNRIVYDARLHPELSSERELVISYNANTLDPDDGYWDARIYRPRFVTVPVRAGARPRGPAAPGQVEARSVGGVAQVNWRPVAGAKGYWLYLRDVTAGQLGFGRSARPVTEPSAPVGFLADGHTFEFRVTAIDGSGESRPSETVRTAIDADIPASPTGLRATTRPDGWVGLDWTPSPGGNHWYVLEQRDVTAGEATFTQVPLQGSGGVTATARRLAHGHTYEFRLSAQSPAGKSPPSAPALALAAAQPPPSPANLRVTSVAGGARLAWDAPRPDLRYWIFRRDVGTRDFPTRLPHPLDGVTELTVDRPRAGAEYEFVVVASTSGGDSAPSNPVRVG